MNGRKIRFDGWVLDRDSGDLFRAGARQRLQELPLKVLDMLLANPGGVVTREQLIAHLWAKGVVDFDTSLNTAVRKLRVALGDVADTPRYIETLPRRGYRFIATLDPDEAVVERAQMELPSPTPQEENPPHAAPAAGLAVGATPDGDCSAVKRPAADAALQQPPAPDQPTTPSRRGIGVGVAVMIALVAAGLSYRKLHPSPQAVIATPIGSDKATPPLPDRSVAVLPFENLSADANNEFLALGIAEMVLHRLAERKDLTVIARTSSFVFKNRNADARDIGRTLDARYLVEGSVQRVGDRLRVQAELVDAASGHQLWSLALDRRLADVFTLQDEISTKVADAFLASSTQDTSKPAERTSKIDAYLAYLQGRALISTSKIADVEAAVAQFAHAVDIDPGFAAAYAQEAGALRRLGELREIRDPKVAARAAALNDTALALDPLLGEAWVERANAGNQTTPEAIAVTENEYLKGLALAPNYGQGYANFAEFLEAHNRVDEAIAMVDKARRIDPLTPRNHYLKALFLWESGRDSAEVKALLLQALKINPTFHPALTRLGQWYNFRGEFAEGAKLQEHALAIEPQADWLREAAAKTYLNIGDTAAAKDVLGAHPGKHDAFEICIHAVEGDLLAAAESAFALFENASRQDYQGETAERCAAAAIRDEATATRHFDRALRLLEAQYSVHAGTLDDAASIAFIWGLPYAQTLQEHGDKTRAVRLARAALAAIERVINPTSAADATYWRAVALGVLGESAASLDSLEAAARGGLHVRWWMIEREPAFTPIKHELRYQAIIAALSDTARRQATLVAEMRTRHELPQRPRTDTDTAKAR